MRTSITLMLGFANSLGFWCFRLKSAVLHLGGREYISEDVMCVCVCGCVWKSRVWSRIIYFPHLPILCIFGTRVIWYIDILTTGSFFPNKYRELEDQGLLLEFTPKICENYYLPKEALLNSTHCCWPHLYIHFPWTPKPWNVKVLNPRYMGYNP